MSWDQTYNDVYLLDLKTGNRRSPEHWGTQRRLSPGGKYLLHFDEKTGHWLTYRVADGARVNLTDIPNVRFQQENRHTGSARRLWHRRLDRRRRVGPALRPVRHLGGQAGRHVAAQRDHRRRPQSRVAFRYRSIDPEERAVPANKPLLLSATDDRTRATGFYRLPR